MNTQAEIFFPPFRFDGVNEQLWRDEQLIPLRPKTFAILRYLVEHPGRLITKDELLRAVWGETLVSDEGLRDYIREIRQALGDDATAPRFVETVRGRGYRFLPTITTQPVPGSRFQAPSSPAKETGSRPGTLNLERGTSLVGRNADLVELHERLEKALSGERQLVFVTGEPGIGKTALVEAFLANVGAHDDAPGVEQGVWLTHGQCIEQHGSGEAFLPILDALGRLCRGPEGERIIAVLRRHAPMWLVQLPAFIETEELETLQRKVQGASRERMLREIAETLEVLTADRPLLLVLEDLHWSDVSTLDFLAFLARRKEPAQLMIVGTYRPVEMLSEGHPLKGIVQELYGHGLAVELALGALREADIERYLEKRFGVGVHVRAPLQFARPLHQRTGGNPLFLVAMVNDLVTRRVLRQAEDGWTLQEEIDTSGIPESIRHLVARQSGRLQPEEQHTLEAASVAGMEFSAAAVAAALTTDTAMVEHHCEQLAQRQQFLKRLGVEEWPDGTLAARYTFLHALYQQLWHERITPTQLQCFHRQIGERKEQAYGEQAREIATELAVHFEQGRDYRRAVRYLQFAGENAARRSANVEAVSHLTKGLEVLKISPDTVERAQQELTLQIALSGSLMALKGYSALEVGEACGRARELSRQVGDARRLVPALAGLEAFYVIRGEVRVGRELADQLLRLAHSVQNAALLQSAHYGMGEVLYHLGELTESRAHLDQAIALYDPQKRRAYLFHDPGVTCLSIAALTLWSLGYPDQARQRMQESLSLAQALSHPFSLAFALQTAAEFHVFCQDGRTAQEQTEALIILSREQGFALRAATGTILRGWALAEQGQVGEGVAQMREGLAFCRTAGAELYASKFLTLLVWTYGKVGQVEEGLTLLAEALVLVDKTGARVSEAELYRLKGELTLQLKVESYKSQVEEAEECFLKAIDIARRQQAKMLELRATVSLAWLWQQQGKHHEARQRLAEIYHWFTEGFDTVDLKEAKTLLEELER